MTEHQPERSDRPRALVTGASSGIGLELARKLAARGYDVALVARRGDRLAALAEDLQAAHGATCLVIATDLAERSGRQAIADRLDGEGWAVDVLVNNAGFGTHGPFAESAHDRQLAMIEVNISALVDLTHRLVGPMVRRGSGRVLNVASTAAFQPGPGMATYCATKAFVMSFGEALATELSGTGVTVTSHCPGATESGFGAIAGNDKTLLFQKGSVASSSTVAEHALRAMERGRVVSVHGAMNWCATQMVRFVPRFAVRRAAGAILSRRDS